MMARRLACLTLIAVLVGGCAARPLVTVAPGPASHAWWLRATFDPQGRAVHGVPVASLHPGWCAADELTRASFEDIERADGRDAWAPRAPRYSVPGPEVDGRATRVQLVVYRACGGSTGTAMLLIDPAAALATRIVTVDVLASPAGYAMLDSDGPGHVVVVHCQECDATVEYRWDAASRRWEELPEPREDGA